MKQSRFHLLLKAASILAAALVLSCSRSDGRLTSAEAFLRDFNIDRLAAYEKYKDKDIILMGKAVRAREEKDGQILLGLVGGAKLTENILCYFEGGSPPVRSALFAVREGESVTVNCQLASLPMEPAVSLERCQLHR